MNNKKIVLRQYPQSADTAYVELFDHPHSAETGGIVDRTISVHEMIEDYNGPSLYLDLDRDGRPVGIEILYPSGTAEGDIGR